VCVCVGCWVQSMKYVNSVFMFCVVGTGRTVDAELLQSVVRMPERASYRINEVDHMTLSH
jgi:hypothetical protein